MKSISKLALAAALALGFGLASTAKADVLDTDMLRPGQAMTYTVHLLAGQYVSYAAQADGDARDVDMRVIAPNGACIASDTLCDAYPVVQFVAPFTGTYRIRVEMISSAFGVPCYFDFIRL